MNATKSAAVMVALVIAGASADSRADDDPWWGTDKALHLTVGHGLGAAGYGGLWLLSDDEPAVKLALATFAASLPGIAKEIYDDGQPGNRFSAKDLLWTEVGVLSGVLTVWLIERLTRSRSGVVVALSPRGLAVTMSLE
jgi:uncharacterized protein YfiM (DUF2279 family)